MSAFSSLPDNILVQISEQASPDSEFPESAALNTELSRRATTLCTFLDTKSARLCRLNNWSIRLSGSPRHRGAVILIGQAFGHPNFPNGTYIATSPVEIILRAADADLAITQNSIYVLDTVNPDLIEAFTLPE